METDGTDTLPPYPPTPQGIARLKHLPTVEAGILYWSAISQRAWEAGDDSLLETANGLKACYEEAKAELLKTDEPKPAKPVRAPRKARPPG